MARSRLALIIFQELVLCRLCRSWPVTSTAMAYLIWLLPASQGPAAFRSCWATGMASFVQHSTISLMLIPSGHWQSAISTAMANPIWRSADTRLLMDHSDGSELFRSFWVREMARSGQSSTRPARLISRQWAISTVTVWLTWPPVRHCCWDRAMARSDLLPLPLGQIVESWRWVTSMAIGGRIWL